ncbi:MAG: hypothetical protein AAFX81_10740 [Pseudomonadota bacterium]
MQSSFDAIALIVAHSEARSPRALKTIRAGHARISGEYVVCVATVRPLHGWSL